VYDEAGEEELETGPVRGRTMLLRRRGTLFSAREGCIRVLSGFVTFESWCLLGAQGSAEFMTCKGWCMVGFGVVLYRGDATWP
jgi:hypothetical protein